MREIPVRVSVEVSGLGFSAGHFVSEGGKCERLHGHNYGVSACVEGEVDAKGMVADFRVVKQLLRHLCEKWDHRVLLPSRSQSIRVTAQESGEVKVVAGGKDYCFPAEDVRVLEVVETTAEELARLLCQELAKELRERFPSIRRVSVTVAESPTQQATATVDLQV